MLTNVCQYLRNWFERDKLLGNFKIVNGILTNADGTALPLLNGQYFRIVGSVLNDGVFLYDTDTASELSDEEFSGAVWSMSVPRDFLALVDDIDKWCTENALAINSPYEQETVGGYSYKMKNSGAGAGTWQSQFASRLNAWRKI